MSGAIPTTPEFTTPTKSRRINDVDRRDMNANMRTRRSDAGHRFRWSKPLTWVTTTVFVALIAGAYGLGHSLVANISVAASALGVGILLSFVMFLGSDGTMRPLKTLVLGAISGTGLAKSEAILGIMARRYGDLGGNDAVQQYLGGLTFFMIGSGLAGVLGGFLALRLGLERVFVREQEAVSSLLKEVPDVPLTAAPDFDEFWPALRGRMPDDATVEKLAQVEDWAEARAADVLRAAAVFMEKKRYDDALRALEHLVIDAEPPSPLALDLYAASLVGKNDWKVFDVATTKLVDRISSRALTYWAASFLVNLDIGYLNLYVAGNASLAIHYARRALDIRPNSRAAHMNLACALAQQYATTPSEATVDEIIAQLVAVYGGPPGSPRFNQEGDFDEVLKSPRFAAWAGVQTSGEETVNGMYYSSDNAYIYHKCDNCSVGKQIPVDKKKDGRPAGAQLCSECDDRARTGSCA